jgi:hypothetical protein
MKLLRRISVKKPKAKAKKTYPRKFLFITVKGPIDYVPIGCIVALLLLSVVAVVMPVNGRYVYFDDCHNETIDRQTVKKYKEVEKLELPDGVSQPEERVIQDGYDGEKRLCKRPWENDFRVAVLKEPADQIIHSYKYTEPEAEQPAKQSTAKKNSSGNNNNNTQPANTESAGCSKTNIVSYRTITEYKDYLYEGETQEVGGSDGYTFHCPAIPDYNIAEKTEVRPPVDKLVYIGTKKRQQDSGSSGGNSQACRNAAQSQYQAALGRLSGLSGSAYQAAAQAASDQYNSALARC